VPTRARRHDAADDVAAHTPTLFFHTRALLPRQMPPAMPFLLKYVAPPPMFTDTLLFSSYLRRRRRHD